MLRAVICCSAAVAAAAAVVTAVICLKKRKTPKEEKRMVFKFLKKLFGSEAAGGEASSKALTNGRDAKDGEAVVIGEESSGALERTATTAAQETSNHEALMTLNKWINLLDCFVGSWSESLSKVAVMEALQERLLTVDPLLFDGDCAPQIAFKENSELIEDESKKKFLATTLEIGDLLLFNGLAPSPTASRTAALESAYDFLLDLRNLISTFKKAFYFTNNDQMQIVETLASSNGGMFQRTEEAEVTRRNASFSASITLTNMAYFSERAASREAAARSVAHQACEYLRKVAQIGSITGTMRNIYGGGGGGSSSRQLQTTIPKDVVDGGGKPKQAEVVLASGKKPSVVVPSSSSNKEKGVSAAAASAVQPSTSASPPPANPIPIVKLTSSLTDAKLINRWALLLENFSSITDDKKSKWQARRELEAKGPREATPFVRPFRETIKPGEEGYNEKEGGDVQYVYWGIAEVAGLLKLREKGKDELDGKDNALKEMFRFLKLMLGLLKEFWRRHQTETGKTNRGLVKGLSGLFLAILTVQVEKEMLQQSSGSSSSQKSTTQLFTVTIELLHVTTISATSTKKQAAREAAAKALVDLLLAICPSKVKSEVARGKGPFTSFAEIGPTAAGSTKKKTVASSSSLTVDLKKTVEADEVVGRSKDGGGQPVVKASSSLQSALLPSPSPSAVSPKMPLVFFNKNFNCATPTVASASSPSQQKQPHSSSSSVSTKGGGVASPAKTSNQVKATAGPKFYYSKKKKKLIKQQQQQQQQEKQPQQQRKNILYKPAAQKNGTQNVTSPASSSSSSTTKKSNLEPNHSHALSLREVIEDIEEEIEQGEDDDVVEEEEEDLWKTLDCISASSSTSPPPSPTALPQPSFSTPSTPSASPSPASEEVAPPVTLKLQKKVTKGGVAKVTEVPTEDGCSEAQLRTQIPALVQLISRYSDAVDQVSKLEGVFSKEITADTLKSLLGVVSSSPLHESLAWSILRAMQAAGQPISDSLSEAEEAATVVGMIPKHLFTLSIECADRSCWRAFTFTATSPVADALYLDGPPCRQEAARVAVGWLADLANLLGQFHDLYLSKTLHLSEEQSEGGGGGHPLKLQDPAALIKELKRCISNRNLLRMSPISKRQSRSGNPVYSCSVFIDRLATFVGEAVGRCELAEAAAAQKTIDFLLELLQTNVKVVADDDDDDGDAQQ